MNGILTPELLLRGYASGIFPMAETRTSEEVFWVDPKKRGILPLDGFHISRSLAKTLRQERFAVSIDRDFDGVVQGCADRPETWINDTIFSLYRALYHGGFAHSIEVWDGPELAGGVYGVAIGGAFFGESMFSRRTDASKVALCYLVDRLRVGGFSLFDTQFVTGHLRRLGALEVIRSAYRKHLAYAIEVHDDFNRQGPIPTPQDVIQRNTQTS